MAFKIDQSDNFGVGFNLGVSNENHHGFLSPFFSKKLKFKLDARILDNKFLRVVCYRYHVDQPQ